MGVIALTALRFPNHCVLSLFPFLHKLREGNSHFSHHGLCSTVLANLWNYVGKAPSSATCLSLDLLLPINGLGPEPPECKLAILDPTYTCLTQATLHVSSTPPLQLAQTRRTLFNLIMPQEVGSGSDTQKLCKTWFIQPWLSTSLFFLAIA